MTGGRARKILLATAAVLAVLFLTAAVALPSLIDLNTYHDQAVREAHVAAALTHPSSGIIHEVHETEDVIFIPMELVGGKTLREVIGGRALPINDALRIVTEIVEGRARAHRYC